MSGCSPYGSVKASDWLQGSSGDEPDAPIQTQQPVGVNAQVNIGDAIRAVSEVASKILNSKRTERGAAACYESCSECCEGACGCPKCGCPEGECGCGSLGSCLCHFWDLFCIRGEGSERRKTAEFVIELESKYGPVCLLMAEKQSGINLEQKMDSGQKVSRQEKVDLIEACKRASHELSSQFKKVEANSWAESQVNCVGVLNNMGLEAAILEGISVANPSGFDPSNLKIVEGGAAGNFNIEECAKEIFLLGVQHVNDTHHTIMGVIQLSSFLQLLLSVLNCFCNGGRSWLNKKELIALICFLLALRGYGVVNSEGAPQNIDPICTSSLGSGSLAVMRGPSTLIETSLDSREVSEMDSLDGRRTRKHDPYNLKDLCQRLVSGQGPGHSHPVPPAKQFKLLKYSGPLVAALMKDSPSNDSGGGVQDTAL